jgi:trigger factor
MKKAKEEISPKGGLCPSKGRILTTAKQIIAALLVTALLAVLAGCSEEPGGGGGGNLTGDTVTTVPQVDYDALNDFESFEAFIASLPTDVPAAYELANRLPHNPSRGLDEFGHFVGVNARDYVDFADFDWRNIEFPPEVGEPGEEVVTGYLASIHNMYPRRRVRILDRAVENGDLVNIDYVGFIDGVPFAGGDSMGHGSNVTAGSTEFIDDFLTQIIGTMPGETIDVNVYFPDSYPMNPDLAGKPALFVTTINYINSDEEESDDEYANRAFGESFGWTTWEKMLEGVREMAVREQQTAFLYELFDEESGNVTVTVPDRVLWTAAENAIRLYQDVAAENNAASFAAFLESGHIDGGIRGFIEFGREFIEPEARIQIIFQALAEELEIRPDNNDVRAYMDSHGGRGISIDDAAKESGLPKLKRDTLEWMVRSRITQQ